jgi:hypothetical protein
LTYGATYVQGTTIPDVKPLKGTAYKNVPLSVEITCYGDTVSIDLTDNTIEYGNGNKPYTLSGSELMQDSSTNALVHIPTSDGLASNVLSEYEYGKETAVLKCNIGDYYDTNGNLTISTNTVVPKCQYETTTTEVAPSYFAHGLRFTIDKPYANDINIRCTVSYSNVTTPILVTIPSGTTTVSVNVYSGANSIAGITVSNVLIDNGTLPMTFKIGDIVIPYVFGVGGQDKPMSRYKDGSPKQYTSAYKAIAAERVFVQYLLYDLHRGDLNKTYLKNLKAQLKDDILTLGMSHLWELVPVQDFLTELSKD